MRSSEVIMNKYHKSKTIILVFFFVEVSLILLISQDAGFCGTDNIQDIRVRIIQSWELGHFHYMDLVWDSVAQAMGYNSSIVPQSFLDDTNNIQNTEILIISAGCISIPSNRVETIKKFLTHGRNVYLQTEYTATYTTNIAFQNLVNQLGGSFSWTMTVNGNLQPMNILGSLSQIPNPVPSINYFYYGCAGSGDSTVENCMLYQGNYFGFVFTPPNTSYGKMITSSDQDWIQSSTSLALMQNILYRLVNTLTGVQNNRSNAPAKFYLSQNYPNPFNPVTKIKFDLPKSSNVKLVIYDVLGREIETLLEENKKPGTYEIDWDGSRYASGVYFYKLITDEYVESRKMVLIK